MLADFYNPRLLNDMKIAVDENHFGSQILYRSLGPSIKNGVVDICNKNFESENYETEG